MASRKSDDLLTRAMEKWVGRDQKRADALLNKQREGWLKIVVG
jgi:hypothetical protein